MTNTYSITTGMGRSSATDLPFLSKNEKANFDNIGYSGKLLNGERMEREQYLNSLGKGYFEIKQTKFDDGSFEEMFTITRTTKSVSKNNDTPLVKIEKLMDKIDRSYMNTDDLLCLTEIDNIIADNR